MAKKNIAKKMEIKRRRTDGILTKFDKLRPDTKDFFKIVPQLLNDKYEAYIILASVFSLIEKGQNEALYLGITKIHKANINLTRDKISKIHIIRKNYLKFFKNVFSQDIPDEILKPIKSAKTVRDNIIHGKKVKKADVLGAVWNALEYANRMNEFLGDRKNNKIFPYGKNKGGRGKVKSLPQNTTVLLLNGIFSENNISENSNF